MPWHNGLRKLLRLLHNLGLWIHACLTLIACLHTHDPGPLSPPMPRCATQPIVHVLRCAVDCVRWGECVPLQAVGSLSFTRSSVGVLLITNPVRVGAFQRELYK